MTRRPTRRDERHAVAAVELAVLLPFLMFLFVVAVDYSRIFYYALSLENCARNGAYYASNYPGLYGYTSVSDAALSDAPNFTPAPVFEVRYAATEDGPFTSTTVTQDKNKLPTGYVQVTATWTFKTITTYPGLPKSTELKKSVRMRVAPVIPF